MLQFARLLMIPPEKYYFTTNGLFGFPFSQDRLRIPYFTEFEKFEEHTA